MEKTYKVAIQFQDKCGLIEYEPNKPNGKKITVTLDNQDKRQEIEKYLATGHVIRVVGNSLLDFSDMFLNPSENVDNFKIVLTRLWHETGVLVDWSRPV